VQAAFAALMERRAAPLQAIHWAPGLAPSTAVIRRLSPLAWLVVAIAAIGFPATAFAAPPLPPTISKAFGPATINANGTASLTLTISNPNTAPPLNGVAFTDNLPAGLVVNTPSGLTNTCGGTATAIAGSGTILLTGGTVAKSASCTVSLNVTASAAGTYVNTTSAVSSTNAGTGNTATATLIVTSAPPSISKVFGAASINVNGTTSLNLTISNQNPTTILNGVAFTDNFPAGLVVNTPSGLTNTCGGTLTASAGSGAVSLTGGTVAANSSCTVSLNVTASAAGNYVNTTGPVSSTNAGTGNTATATLVVVSPLSATHFSVSAPANATIGNAFMYTITALDAMNSVVTGYSGTVHFTSTDAMGILPANSTLTSGVGTFSATFNTAGGQTITASDGTIIGTSAIINVAAASVSNTTLTSSVNPSQFRQTVTFTAMVTGSGGSTPTGNVTFKDGATVLGTNALNASAVATLSVATLTVGSHSITAIYSGDTNFAASTSSFLTQTVNIPTDSAKLRSLQLEGTKIEAQSSGNAISGAIDAAIGGGFSEGGPPIMASDNGVHFNFAVDPRDTRTEPGDRVDNSFSALGYAPTGKALKARPLAPYTPMNWLAWADVRGTGWSTNMQTGDIRGDQINALFGITRKLAPDFLVGVFGGYENFNYRSQLLDGQLKGDGWTVGGYLSWRILPTLRFDAGLARSGIGYDGTAGTASGTFPGNRWLGTAALIGTYNMSGFQFEPSAKVYALWEHEGAYVDTLGTTQSERNFSTGRASGGVKVAYPLEWSAGTTVAPYIGLYADYYFNSDEAALPIAPLLPTEYVSGWSARVGGGVAVTVTHGPKFSLDGVFGGLASNQFTNWTVRGHVSLPF
jgi:hypothetical protein